MGQSGDPYSHKDYALREGVLKDEGQEKVECERLGEKEFFLINIIYVYHPFVFYTFHHVFLFFQICCNEKVSGASLNLL